jgi:polysaccharide pyruvyl transferase WcaK-like protein
VGLFGKLGSGNIGNDASMEAVLAYLKADHPEAIVDAMCGRPQRITDRYGIDATPLHWYSRHEQVTGLAAAAFKIIGRFADAYRTAVWVRHHDVVIVPGMGVLEATLPQRPWQFPYTMFLLSVSGRLFGAKVALVSVGAHPINQRLTRWLLDASARLAFYRSYRDKNSLEAMRKRGVDTSHDHVYPDLAYAIPVPPYDPGDARTVGVGVMAYYGDNDDRGHAEQLYASYLENMKAFVRWLVDNGRRVRLFVGDANGSDDEVVQEILADLRESRPDLAPGSVVAEPMGSFAELTRSMEPAATVVATRYHNVMCALKLSKPAISIGYSTKHDSLMADMGLAEFCLSAGSLDASRLIERFTELEARAATLQATMLARNELNARLLADQFATLSALLFPSDDSGAARQESNPVREVTG